MTATLSLADIARLARVERPVVTMWRKRERAGVPFPAPLPDGRFPAPAIVDWLERTGRGNNPNARGDLAVLAATNGTADPDHLAELLAVIAARALLDEPIASFEYADLLDAIEELDPDDEFLFSEVEVLGDQAYATLAAEADALADAAWHPRAAYELVNEAYARSGAVHDSRLHPDLVELCAGVAATLLGTGGTLIDLAGTGTDVAIALATNEELPDPRIALPAQLTSTRAALRRYHVHGISPAVSELDDSWPLTADSVTVARLPAAADRAFAVLDELAVQLPADACALIVGPATALTDPLPDELVARRDEFLRADLVRAAVRLPPGLTRGGTREHLALWLMATPPDRPSLRVGDLGGHTGLNPTTAQSLLDDLVAARTNARERAYALLHLSDRRQIISSGGSVVALAGARPVMALPSAAEDAARIEQLRAELLRPLPDPLPYAPTGTGPGTAQRVSLGEAYRHRLIRLIPGTRLPELPAGSTRIWTTDAVAAQTPASVDLLRLAQVHPDLRLTEPGDVVFTSHGKPAAVVDNDGGAAVPYPARILRARSTRLAPAAIADAINRVPQGNRKWRTWLVPLVQIDPAYANDMLGALDVWESALRQRKTQLDELRQLVIRSVLTGAVTLATAPPPGDAAGPPPRAPG